MMDLNFMGLLMTRLQPKNTEMITLAGMIGMPVNWINISMSKPYIHAQSSAKKYGGVPEDYMMIHEFMDSSKATIPDNRHRALTHNSWFISQILPRVFGETFPRASDGKIISTRDIGEQHVLEDYAGKFIPTASDFLQEMDWIDWMNNGKGQSPTSHAKLDKPKKITRRTIDLGEEVADGSFGGHFVIDSANARRFDKD